MQDNQLHALPTSPFHVERRPKTPTEKSPSRCMAPRRDIKSAGTRQHPVFFGTLIRGRSGTGSHPPAADPWEAIPPQGAYLHKVHGTGTGRRTGTGRTATRYLRRAHGTGTPMAPERPGRSPGQFVSRGTAKKASGSQSPPDPRPPQQHAVQGVPGLHNGAGLRSETQNFRISANLHGVCWFLLLNLGFGVCCNPEVTHGDSSSS